MPEVVQADAVDASSCERGAPAVANGVLVGREVLETGEQPIVAQAQSDVFGEHGDERVGHVHRALGVVLRQSDVDRPALETLNLTPDVDLPAQEVDVADLQSSGLPRRSPAKAHSPTKARNRGSAASKICRTTSGDGIVMAASRLRWRGSRTVVVGSVAIIPSRTAARKTERTFTKRVLIVPGAKGRGRSAVFTVIDFTHASTCLGLTRRRSTSANEVDRAASDMAFLVPSVQT